MPCIAFRAPLKLSLWRHLPRGKPRRVVAPAVAVPPCSCREVYEGVCPVCGFLFPKFPRSVRIGGRLTGKTVLVPEWVPHPSRTGEDARKYLLHHPRTKRYIGRVV